ncbi:CP [Jasmine mosaic-associated virus 1]|nr:CP [Jasmine mosaic-associated virus 1]
MAASDSPAVTQLAATGVPWAVKLQQKGWRSLTKTQKAQARAAGIGSPVVTTVTPKVVRVISGNPANQRRAPGAPGNAMKSMTITKQEFVGSVHADGSIHTLVLDPRDVRTFPLLSTLALGYNKYKFSSLKLRYSPRNSDTNCGFIASYSSDSSDERPSSRFQFYSTSPRYESAASKPLLVTLPIEKTTKFLRDKCTDDAKLVDCGAIHYMVDGAHDGKLGELFLEFTIVFSEPTFVQNSTQYITNITNVRGPQFATVVKSRNTATVTLRSAGHFLCCLHSDLLTNIRRTGQEEALKTQVDSADSSSVIVEIKSEEPLSSFVLTFASPEKTGLRLYVTRM